MTVNTLSGFTQPVCNSNSKHSSIMKFDQWIPLVFCILAAMESVMSKDFFRVCYFASWGRYRNTLAKHDITDIDPFLCTHLIYSFANLERVKGELAAAESFAEEGPNGRFREFNDLKKLNPNLKTLLSIGGETAHSEGFMNITRSQEILAHFTNTSVQFLRERNFDGLDIDWEFPDATTSERLTALLKSLREAFDAESPEPDRRLLLTLAGAPGKEIIDAGYNIPAVAQYVDFANLMAYDYTASSAQVAAFNSPLYSRPDPRFNPTLSTNWTVHHWHERGLPLDKIVVGTTGVGRRLVLDNPSLTEPGSKVTGEVRPGDYYAFSAGLAYPEICLWLMNSSTVRVFDAPQQNPYIVLEDNWVGYEDVESMGVKVDWMLNLGVKGFMFWSLDQDDFSGQYCGEGKYPLVSTVKNKTAPHTLAPETTTTTTKRLATPSPKTTTTPDNGSGQVQSSDLQLFFCVYILFFCFLWH